MISKTTESINEIFNLQDAAHIQ